MSSSIHISGDRKQDRGKSARGQLKVFLGYAAGVGKTLRMLEEAQELKRQGEDIVVGYFEPHKRKDTIARLDGLEVAPRRAVAYRGGTFQEMDTTGIERTSLVLLRRAARGADGPTAQGAASNRLRQKTGTETFGACIV